MPDGFLKRPDDWFERVNTWLFGVTYVVGECNEFVEVGHAQVVVHKALVFSRRHLETLFIQPNDLVQILRKPLQSHCWSKTKLEVIEVFDRQNLANFVNQLLRVVYGLIHVMFEIKLKQVVLPHKSVLGLVQSWVQTNCALFCHFHALFECAFNPV